MLVALFAYTGMRPQEILALRWAHVLTATLVVHAPKTRRYRPHPRSVRLLAPLAQDLREWRMKSGRPADTQPVIPALDGAPWTGNAYDDWRAGAWKAALEAAGDPYQRPYEYADLLVMPTWGRKSSQVGLLAA
jgi:integrase